MKLENLKLSEEKKEMEKNLTNEIKILKEELEEIKKENQLMKNILNENNEKLKSSEELKNKFEKMEKLCITSLWKNPKIVEIHQFNFFKLLKVMKVQNKIGLII